MDLEVSVLYSLSLDVGQCIEKMLKSLISEFEMSVGVNKNVCLKLLGDIETCIDMLKWVEKGFLVSAIVLHKHEYEFKIDDLKKKALELHNKLHLFIYTINRDYNTNIFGLFFSFLSTRKNIYGEENITNYFRSMKKAFIAKNN